MYESSKVKEFWKLEQKGKSDGKHLNELLEERAREAVKEKNARIKTEANLKRGKLIGASGEKYPTREMDQKYIGEEKGEHFEDAFFQRLSVKYLSEAERAQYEIFVGQNDGLLYDVNGELVNTNDAQQLGTMGEKKGKNAIFVMGGDGRIYLSKIARIGEFHHSSLLGGEPVAVAGEAEIIQTDNPIYEFDNNSGHYPYGPEGLILLKTELQLRGVNIDKITFIPFTKK